MSQKTGDKNNCFKTRIDALEASKDIKGCKGRTHIHRKDGKKCYMPCSSHSKYKELSSQKDEVTELIDFDGTIKNSKIPILDPQTTANGSTTMDKTVASTRITQDPLMRGYRVYYGESIVREEDMSDAFGFEETKELNGEETMDYFQEDLGFSEEESKDRTEEIGKDPEGEMDKNSKFKDKKGFIAKMKLKERKNFTKEEIVKMSEDVLTDRSEIKELTPKNDIENEISPIIKRNITSLKNMASAEGISLPELIKLMKKK